MLLILLASVVAVISLTVVLSIYNKISNDRDVLSKGYKVFPEPPGWLPLIGHLRVLMNQSPEEKMNRLLQLEQFMRQCGKDEHAFRLYMPGRCGVFTTDPEVVKYITSTKHEKTFFKGQSTIDRNDDFLGKGIFNVNGREWKNLRSTASKLFLLSSLRKFVGVFNRNAHRLFDKMEKIRQSDKYKTEGVDMQDLFMRYTLDSFAEIGFGVDLGSIENGDRSDFSVAFDYVQTHTYHRVKYGKLWRAKEWLFPPREFQRSLAVMDNVVYAIIRGRENDPVETLKDNTDVLSQLMYELRDEESYPDREKHLRDFIMNFLIAGRDTTAMLLTWTFHLLAEHPEVEQKCLQEIEQVLGDDELTWDNVKACKYIKMVLQETLRMYPPVPVDGYAASEDEIAYQCAQVLPGNYYIRKGTSVLYVAALMHRRADLFPEPDKFIPERWEKSPPHPYAYVPFHAGPRQCLGKEMAYEEAKVMVINMLRRYRLRTHKGYEPKVKAAIILTSQNGMHMDIEDA